jgi:hypothetical protein
MTPETINLTIAFGGVALIGVILLAAAWLLGEAEQKREPPRRNGEQPLVPRSEE